MKFNPESEIRYRIKLSTLYLRDAVEAFNRGDYRAVVASSQLSIENSAKAIIAIYRVPSWSHDPSNELKELLPLIPGDLHELVEELINIVKRVAPEHGRAKYGEPARGLTPWDIYGERDAVEALTIARRAKEIMDKILERLSLPSYDPSLHESPSNPKLVSVI